MANIGVINENIISCWCCINSLAEKENNLYYFEVRVMGFPQTPKTGFLASMPKLF